MAMETAGFTYGSDTSGLVWGFLFGRDGPPLALDATAALAWLADGAARPAQEFVWLHFNLSHAASEKWLMTHTQLADEFYETLHQGSRSTRIEQAENTLIAVVNDVVHNFSFEASDI
ncbi:MAG: magnesium transporter CorA, partial [Janthinobacterium sp.]|nr:magnesium transporter CorA [Janthinobacterium sp.]